MSTHANHPFHLVEKSPWPLTASLGAMLLTSGLVMWFHKFSMLLFSIGLISTLLSATQWWRDVSREGSLQGLHTKKVVTGLQMGMILFIVSEILFFFSFFWAFFHSSLNPTAELGGVWPPTSIESFNPFSIPLLNTAILISSGISVTWAHHALLQNNHSQTIQGLVVTILLGVYFSALQALEYLESPFSIADSVYGSTFFIATGFHGLHVIIGTIFLLISMIRIKSALLTPQHHTGLESAIWYWHFVDVVWLFLFVTIYWWGW
uniref:Cytochrome c oxidase subunit 3 n=1 Tax=Gondogeneia antarctica TaxID=1109128 RepID=G8IQP8_GONAN|nr:cytochrome c oxidase subunit III [Gondogeneia antarctica]